MMIEIEDLWSQIDVVISPLESETASVIDASGRCLVERPIAVIDFPAFDHSAMDGYAFAEAVPGRCRIVEEIPAGQCPRIPLAPGHATRVFTGAMVPPNAFAVAMQEKCVADGEHVSLASEEPLVYGSHIRRRATIVAAGQPILDPGQILLPGAVALLSACGVGSVQVPRRPKATHIATGSELLVAGEVATDGKIADSNGPMIEALLAAVGISAARSRMDDDLASLTAAADGFAGDLLLISGGSGPGDHDHTRCALETAGFTVWGDRVNSRPGKPLLFATRGRQAAFGLPGNPLSHWVCFHAFVRRAIDRMQGGLPCDLVETICSNWEPTRGDGRRSWTPARLAIVGGQAHSHPLPWLHSGDLSPLAMADALLLDAPDLASHRIQTLIL